MDDNLIKELVFRTLNDRDGKSGIFLRDIDARDIANDLVRCDKDLENYTPADLLPHVIHWQLTK